MRASWLTFSLFAPIILIGAFLGYGLYTFHDSKTIWLELSNATSLIALVIGLSQLISVRHNSKVRETLAACERYDTDSVLTQCLRNVKQGEDEQKIHINSLAYSLDIITILNYLEGIAIGISQGLYDEKVAKDHLEPIIRYHVEKHASPEAQQHFHFDALGDYDRLIALNQKWQEQRAHIPTHYRA